METVDHASHQPVPVSLREASRTWAQIALMSFGGPAGQIALMHRVVVEEKRWIGEARFLHALNFCTLLPGPEAQQLATYIGWLMHGLRGGIVAGALFILPGFVAIMALSWLYVLYGNVGVVAALFFGLKAAVLAIVLQAVQRIASRTLRSVPMVGLAGAAFVAIYFLDVPFPIIIVGAGLIGLVGGRAGLAAFSGVGHHGKAGGGAVVHERDTLLGEGLLVHARPAARRQLRVAAVLLLLWTAPTLLLLAWLGPDHVFSQIALFFSQMAVVTFGGAYAVLAYVAQQAVETYGWLQPGEMLDGLGLAETTPGPLIMVTQFVGFLGTSRFAGGGLDPMLAGTLGAVLTTWVTFVPCFLWIFLGAPHAERLRGNATLSGGLAAITAAVVGVILNLAIWFGLNTLFTVVKEVAVGALRFDWPVLASLDLSAALLAAAAAVAAFRFKVGPLPLLAGAAAAGLLVHLGTRIAGS